ncbi:MAG TPA: hypothetical protein IAB72_02155 [Candidatus Onthoplasma faecipullorum]|nr:hypothetical protein [Candidatus Onthoplasma faecipullorum]
MSIYKSSFNSNKKPEKKEKVKVEKVKPAKEKKAKVKSRVKPSLVFLIVCAVIFVLCLFPNFMRNVILGVMGLSVYPITLIGFFFSLMFFRGKTYTIKKKYVVYLSISLFIVWFIFHLILTSRIPLNSYGQFLVDTYHAKTTAGGLLFSLISYPVVKLLTIVGAYIFSAIALAIFVGLIIDYMYLDKSGEKKEVKMKFDFKNIEDFEINEEPTKPISKEEQQKTIAKQRLGLTKGETTIISSNMPNLNLGSRAPESRPISKRDYILTPLDPVIPTASKESIFQDDTTGYSKPKRPQKTNFDEDIKAENAEEIKPATPFVQNELPATPTQQEVKPNIPTVEQTSLYSEDLNSDDNLFVDNAEDYSEISSASDNAENNSHDEDKNNFEDIYEEDNVSSEDETTDDFENNAVDVDEEEVDQPNEQEEELQDLSNSDNTTSLNSVEITPNLNKTEYLDDYSNSVKLGSTVETEVVRPSVDISKFHLPNQNQHSLVEEKPAPTTPQKLNIPPYVAPPVDLLNYLDNPTQITDDELQENIDRLEQVLEDFKVPAKVKNVQVGPAVTRYEISMPPGISVNKIAQMSNDIAMTLASNGSIRVEAPIPGKNLVGVEVPNKNIASVSLRELIDSNEFRQRGNPLSFVLGKDINGDIIFCNLDKMPHLLVAGSTGSGKSVCLNTMLLSMCYKAGPQDIRLILVDPKMVEFTTYNGLPHLLIPEVITNKDMAVNALDWAIKEMERRYALFAKNHVVNINEFNKSDIVKSKKEDKLPYIVIVVDELADLMLEAKREIEDRIAKLAAKARAAGIHLVLATQRPSVDVITGTVKANLPSRIAFALTNYMDSKTVLDGGGAEKLLGKGDMLFKPQDKPEPRRVQGAFVSNPEIAKVVEYIKQHNNPVYDENAGRAIKNPHQGNGGHSGGGATNERDMEFDPVLKDALRMFIQTKQASGSMISRRYSVGFNRAGRIMDQMERAGFIGPQEGSKPRQVLITMDEYKQIFGDDEN